MKLYHYTTFDSFVKIWSSKELRLCIFKNMNDIFEQQKFCRLDISQGNGIPETIREEGSLAFIFKQIAKFQQISFTQDYDSETKGYMSSMMWGQYAKNEKGVCIEFDKDKLLCGKGDDYLCGQVDYTDSVPYINIDSSYFRGEMDEIEQNIRNFILENQKVVFFCKHSHWQPENEFRIISDKQKTISIKDAITCIYVQKRESMETTLRQGLIENQIPIKYIYLYPSDKYIKMDARDINE